jgi:hypothetical protein
MSSLLIDLTVKRKCQLCANPATTFWIQWFPKRFHPLCEKHCRDMVELLKCDMCGTTAEKMGKLSIKTGAGILDGLMPKYNADICDDCISKVRKMFHNGK